jgi:hypothetical protein
MTGLGPGPCLSSKLARLAEKQKSIFNTKDKKHFDLATSVKRKAKNALLTLASLSYAHRHSTVNKATQPSM